MLLVTRPAAVSRPAQALLELGDGDVERPVRILGGGLGPHHRTA